MTLRQLDALKKRHDQRIEHDEYMFGQLTSYLVNFSFRGAEKPTRPRDFMPSQFGKTTQAKPRRVTQKRKKAAAEALRLFFPPPHPKKKD